MMNLLTVAYAPITHDNNQVPACKTDRSSDERTVCNGKLEKLNRRESLVAINNQQQVAVGSQFSFSRTHKCPAVVEDYPLDSRNTSQAAASSPCTQVRRASRKAFATHGRQRPYDVHICG